MELKLTRREFLKTTAALTSLPAAKTVQSGYRLLSDQAAEQPNIILILFDALSALHLSLYGYSRETSPNLERFASRANVYHNHRSVANFTTPSTASLFTSTYPWTHRAITLTGLIRDSVKPNNLFKLLSEKYFQTAYTQNVYADMLLYQFDRYLDRHLAPDSFSLAGHTFYDSLSGDSAVYGLKGIDQFIFKLEEAHGSLFLSILNDLNTMLGVRKQEIQLKDLHPHGLPRLANTNVYFLFSQVMDGVINLLDRFQEPHFFYIHLLPPHAPYTPSSYFLEKFNDGWVPEPKKYHKLGTRLSEDKLDFYRQRYDEFIANLDHEFGRLFDHLENSGLMDNSYVIFTSDHGELFERGTRGHSTPLLFEAVVRVPLVISTPGQSQRRDIYDLTSNIDILPTLAKIAGLQQPEWTVGQPLPELGLDGQSQRDLWILEAKKNQTQGELNKVSLALIRGENKLVYFTGYKNYQDKYEFYDLSNDPEELENSFKVSPIAKEMKTELDQKFEKVKQPIQ